MQRIVRIVAVTALVFVCAACSTQGRTEPASARPIKLFNGKDMSGWTYHLRDPNAKMEDVWSIKEGGVLHCKGQPVGYIRTEKPYTNYVLRLQWRNPGKPGNSGVLMRMQPPDKVWPKSIEAQLNSGDAGDIWNIDEFPMKVATERTEGRRTKKAHPSNEKPLGEWNQYEITLDGTNLEIKVNGLVQNTATDVAVMPGPICLQSEGAEIEFRNIELTELATERSSAGSKNPNNSKQLFNGKDLSGWSFVAKDGAGKIADAWSVGEGGVLKCDGSPEGYLKSNEKFKDFVLELDWRWPGDPGNSGVLVRAQEPDKVWPRCLEPQLAHGSAGLPIPLSGFQAKVTKKPEKSSEKPPGEWNRYEIRMHGGKAELKVNGVLQGVVEECDDVAGFIGLQSEGTPIEFQNIVITPSGTSASSNNQLRRLPGLKNWHITGKGSWTYHDGIIEGQQTKEEKSYTHVVSDKTYKDFRASLKFKAIKGNSGFYFRVKIDENGNAHGFQAEIDEARDAGGLYESQGRGWVSQPKKEDVAKYFKPQEWNEMVVEARGNDVVVYVNGAKAAELKDDPRLAPEGHFALQIHGGQDVHVMFKDIKIEPL